MENNIIGIKEDELKKLILEIYDCRDKISKILETAELLVDDTKNYYKSDDGDLFRKKFALFVNNFDILLKNIKSYGDDLETIIYAFKLNNKNSVDFLGKKG